MKLYPYQREGVRFLSSRRRAYLADTMGLGKSAQAITAAGAIAHGKLRNLSTVVVCPASAQDNWKREWEKWKGPGTPRIVSYSSLIRRDWKSWKPDLVILDEAHYAKSPSAKRTRAALGLARDASYAWLLSGTPMPNNPTELWAIFKYLWPERIPEGIRTGQQWMDRFCLTRPTIYGPKPYAVRNGAELRGLLDGMMLRRTVEDVGLDLPPLRVDLVRLPKDRAMTEALADYDTEAEAEESMYATMRRLLGAAKAPRIAKQIVEELDNNAYQAIVVLYYHRDVGVQLRGEFLDAGYVPVGFDGSTPREKRQEAIDAFQAGHNRIFLAQQTAAGVAINLTAANEIVLVEPDWTPSGNQQAIKRVHRIGSDRPCRARVFCVADTMDDHLMDTIVKKVEMAEEVGLHG